MKNKLKAFLLFIFCIILISLFWKNNILLTVLLSISLISILIFFHNKKDLIVIFVSGIGGAVGEAILIYLNVWNYTNPTIFNIPIWLPLAWVHVAIIVLLLR